MKIFKLLLCLILSYSFATAQTVELDKSNGLVTVDGKPSFYVIKKNKGLLSYDISLQNLENKQLAYFANKHASDLPYNMRKSNREGDYYLVSFTQSGNTAMVWPKNFGTLKSYAQQVVDGRLIKDNGEIDLIAEKAFVMANDGAMVQEPPSVNVTVNTPSTGGAAAAARVDISVKGTNIYNEQELIGTFKKTISGGNTILNIYNQGGTKIATASHPDADANADWNVVTDNKTYQVLFSSNENVKAIFKLLAEKLLFAE